MTKKEFDNKLLMAKMSNADIVCKEKYIEELYLKFYGNKYKTEQILQGIEKSMPEIKHGEM